MLVNTVTQIRNPRASPLCRIPDLPHRCRTGALRDAAWFDQANSCLLAPMQILITGATGFTGGHLARTLASRGHAVRALVRPGSVTRTLSDLGIELFEGQLTSADDVLAATAGCEQVYHIAALFRTAGHPDSHYRDVNVGGTLNVLAAARQQGCERVVHCSTGGVHGHVAHPPADENYRFAPDDIYQRSKLEAELAASAAIATGQPVSIFRPGAIYGAGDLRFLKLFRAIHNRRFVMIGSGRTRLHLVHVDDMVQGILLCGSRTEALGQTFIIAGPQAPTLNEIASTAADIMGVPRPRLHIPVWPVYTAGWLCEMLCVPFGIEPPLHRRRVGFFTHHREFDIAKARRLLGFAPQVSVADGIRRTTDWYAQQGYLGARS
jgi:dihydroflavonol-4-reductase